MRPSILGFFTVGMTTLSMLSVSCVLYSAGSGVKRVLVVLSGLRWSCFFFFFVFFVSMKLFLASMVVALLVQPVCLCLLMS